jgi:hypothetical protein
VELFEFTLERASRETLPVLSLSAEPNAEPPVPEDAPIQEILFEPPRVGSTRLTERVKPSVLSFVIADPHVAIRMQHAVRNAYALYGTPGLESLSGAILGDPSRPWKWKLKGEPYHHLEHEPLDFVWSASENKALPRYRYTNAPSRWKLSEHYQQERARLDGILDSTRATVQKLATAIGLERLNESEAQVFRETRRYVRLESNNDEVDDEVAAVALDSGSLALPLKGPDILSLADALVRLDKARLPIRRAEDQYDEFIRPIAQQRAEWAKSRLEALSEEEIREQTNIIKIASDSRAAFPDPPGTERVRENIAEKKAEFSALVATEAFDFPILYRMWEEYPAAVQVARHVLADPSLSTTLQRKQALSSSMALRDAILTTLRVTRNASKRTRKRFEEQELNVWRYPPLVHAALRRLAVPPGTVEKRGVEERLALEAEDINLASALSMLGGYCELGMALAGAAPPMLAAAAAISLLLQAIDWLRQVWKRLEDRDAFNSALNPARCFAAEPSYVGLLIDLAFIALSVRDASRAVRATKIEVLVP